MSEASALRVGAALPDLEDFDVTRMQHVAARLGRTRRLVRYSDPDFKGIFAGLNSGLYDCIASGTTITPEREQMADF